jgi:hypothetical protein
MLKGRVVTNVNLRGRARETRRVESMAVDGMSHEDSHVRVRVRPFLYGPIRHTAVSCTAVKGDIQAMDGTVR